MTPRQRTRIFTERLKLLVGKQPELMTLSNIFTMRLIGNKKHGDLAEIAISEFVYMYDFDSVRIGKDRTKSKEEDIRIVNEITKAEFSVSLKAYGDAAANALQRGLDTKNSFKFFDSITRIDYSHNHVLVELFSHVLVSSKFGHKTALKKIKEDIDFLKQSAEIS